MRRPTPASPPPVKKAATRPATPVRRREPARVRRSSAGWPGTTKGLPRQPVRRRVLTSGRESPMGDYETSTTIDVASNVLFDYLADVERLPEYLPQLTEVHRTGKSAGGERVDVKAVIHPDGEAEREVEGEAWIDVVEDGKKLRWGAPGPHEY